jgi:hypothetical protein
MPPATDGDDETLLLWVDQSWADTGRADAGWFDGKTFWIHDDYNHEVDVSHWQLIVAP